jgi:hypothetical protein
MIMMTPPTNSATATGTGPNSKRLIVLPSNKPVMAAGTNATTSAPNRRSEAASLANTPRSRAANS